MEKLKTNTVIIGAGPGGYAAGIRLGQLGIDTILVEKEKLGGTCLNVGCIPSKALLHASGQYANLIDKESSNLGISTSNPTIDWAKTIVWKNKSVKKLVSGIQFLLKKNNVTVLAGTGKVISQTTVEVSGKNPVTITCQNLILAMGSTIVQLPDFPVNHTSILDSSDLLSLEQPPKSMVIVGGGVIGMELGTVYNNLGCKVTIVEALDKILLNCESEASKIVQKEFIKKGGSIHTNTVASGIVETNTGIKLICESQGEQKEFKAEILAIAVGRKPCLAGLETSPLNLKMDKGRIQVNDHLMTSVSQVYAIGDLIPGPMLAHKATAEGILVAETIAGHKVSKQDILAIPDVVYTKPEIATVGFSEESACRKGIKIKIGKFPLSTLGRAATTNEGLGYIKYIADSKDDRIIGASIVSSRASELISESTFAIEMGATLEDIALTVHPHPSFGEAHMEAAAAGLGKAIHLLNRPNKGTEALR